MLETIEIDPTKTAHSTVIWMHGLGADANDFKPWAEQLELPATRFIFPNAPIRPVSVNGNAPMRAWYDIFGFREDTREDHPGLEQSRLNINLLIEQEIARGIPTSRIAIGGFSQGGALALHTGLRYPETLGAILALSAYLPVAHTLAQSFQTTAKNTPVLLAHGRIDPVVPFAWANKAHDLLKTFDIAVTCKNYWMGHTVCAEELVDVRAFLTSCFAD